MTPFPTPTSIPIDNLPAGFREHVYGMFHAIIAGLKGAQIPFTHITIWDFIIWSIVMAAAIKAIKLMYGKGDSSKHE